MVAIEERIRRKAGLACRDNRNVTREQWIDVLQALIGNDQGASFGIETIKQAPIIVIRFLGFPSHAIIERQVPVDLKLILSVSTPPGAEPMWER